MIPTPFARGDIANSSHLWQMAMEPSNLNLIYNIPIQLFLEGMQATLHIALIELFSVLSFNKLNNNAIVVCDHSYMNKISTLINIIILSELKS